MKYTVVTGYPPQGKVFIPDSEDMEKILISKVNKMIEQGWRPIGGVAIVFTPNLRSQYFSQAMIKD
jgi:hypothetical protein